LRAPMRAKRIINTECIVLSCKGCRKLLAMREAKQPDLDYVASAGKLTS
jgi:hypothetical protein